MFLVITTLSVYWQVKNHAFVNYDDESYVTANIYVLKGLTLKGVTWSLTAAHASNWHPITWLSHMTDSQLYGMNAGMHHLTNVLFHIINTLLLFLVFRRMTGDIWRSGFVAALFALHPVHVESVAWVSERKDVLSAFFWMLTMWSYARYVERSELNRYLLVLMFFMLGLMAKPMIVTLPFVLLLLDYWPLKRFQSGQSGYGDNSQQRPIALGLIWEKMPFFILSAASSVATYLVQQSGEAVRNLDAFPFQDRIGNAMVSYSSYIGKMIWPINLAVFYPFPETIPLWQAAGAGVLLASVTVLVFRAACSKPYLAVGWLWYIGTLVPVIGLVQVGSQSMADRYTYIPLIGLFIIVVWGLSDISAKWRGQRVIPAIFSSVVLISFMICAWFQVRHWQNGITLFTHVLNVTQNNDIAHGELGYALNRHGKYDEAITNYSKALQINPDYKEAHNNLADTLARQGNFIDAIYHYNQALRIDPHYVGSHNNLGNVLARQGNFKDAVYHYKQALKGNSKYAGAYYNLGKIFTNQGKIEDAILNYQKALQFSPNMTQALYNLSWISATYKDEKFRNGEEAVSLAEKLCKITQYNQPLALDALAAAYAETGRFDEAVQTAKKALKLALMYGPQELVLGLKKRLQLYHARLTYRQS
jgi:tetratricopeptide (TPR) repeat protein